METTPIGRSALQEHYDRIAAKSADPTSEAERSVVRWVLSRPFSNRRDILPLAAERTFGVKPGRDLKTVPKRGGVELFGYDGAGRLLLSRFEWSHSPVSFDTWEYGDGTALRAHWQVRRPWQAGDELVWVAHYVCHESGRPLMVEKLPIFDGPAYEIERMTYDERGRLLEILSEGDYFPEEVDEKWRFGAERFEYDGDKLAKITREFPSGRNSVKYLASLMPVKDAVEIATTGIASGIEAAIRDRDRQGSEAVCLLAVLYQPYGEPFPTAAVCPTSVWDVLSEVVDWRAVLNPAEWRAAGDLEFQIAEEAARACQHLSFSANRGNSSRDLAKAIAQGVADRLREIDWQQLATVTGDFHIYITDYETETIDLGEQPPERLRRIRESRPKGRSSG